MTSNSQHQYGASLRQFLWRRYLQTDSTRASLKAVSLRELLNLYDLPVWSLRGTRLRRPDLCANLHCCCEPAHVPCILSRQKRCQQQRQKQCTGCLRRQARLWQRFLLGRTAPRCFDLIQTTAGHSSGMQGTEDTAGCSAHLLRAVVLASHRANCAGVRTKAPHQCPPSRDGINKLVVAIQTQRTVHFQDDPWPPWI